MSTNPHRHYTLRSNSNKHRRQPEKQTIKNKMAALDPADPQYIALTNALENISDQVQNMQTNHANSNQAIQGLNAQMQGFQQFTQTTNTSLNNINQKQMTASGGLTAPTFSGAIVENVTKFITRLDQYARFAGIDDPGKCNLMPFILTSRAKLWHEDQPLAVRNDYGNITQALIAKYGPQACNL